MIFGNRSRAGAFFALPGTAAIKASEEKSMLKRTLLSFLAVLSLCVGFVGCERGAAERAGRRIDRAAEDARDAIEDAGDRIEDGLDRK